MKNKSVPANYINALLNKYSQLPNFPFRDWATEPAQFRAVREFFGELFKAATKDEHKNYENVMEPRMDRDFSPFDVALNDRQKRVAIYPDFQSQGFVMTTNFATDFYHHDQLKFGEMPDRSWLTVSTDFGPKRLIAIFEIIETYALTPFITLEGEKQMDRNFIKSYGHLFDYPASRRKARRKIGD